MMNRVCRKPASRHSNWRNNSIKHNGQQNSGVHPPHDMPNEHPSSIYRDEDMRHDAPQSNQRASYDQRPDSRVFSSKRWPDANEAEDSADDKAKISNLSSIIGLTHASSIANQGQILSSSHDPRLMAFAQTCRARNFQGPRHPSQFA